ncbi:hypothetical protein SPLC1_S010300 [Arthrospira platensis C1]|nr:hypothetical protein SPLC1_S010300 [Arthrospira platensis C1]
MWLPIAVWNNRALNNQQQTNIVPISPSGFYESE